MTVLQNNFLIDGRIVSNLTVEGARSNLTLVSPQINSSLSLAQGPATNLAIGGNPVLPSLVVGSSDKELAGASEATAQARIAAAAAISAASSADAAQDAADSTKTDSDAAKLAAAQAVDSAVQARADADAVAAEAAAVSQAAASVADIEHSVSTLAGEAGISAAAAKADAVLAGKAAQAAFDARDASQQSANDSAYSASAADDSEAAALAAQQAAAASAAAALASQQEATAQAAAADDSKAAALAAQQAATEQAAAAAQSAAAADDSEASALDAKQAATAQADAAAQSAAAAAASAQDAIVSQVQANWTEADTANKGYIKNKPALAAVATTGAKADVGLGSVDNTSDVNKPVSTAQAAAIALKQDASAKDASDGFAGLTLFKLNLKNAAGAITSFLTNAATVARTWTFPDKDGTVAMLSDITGTNSGTNTGDETLATIKTKLGIATLSGSNTGDQTLASLGIPNVDNTSDVNKPVSTAQQAALDLKAPLTGAGASGTWPIGVSGNAATATKLATPRTINGVTFDGTANITLAKADIGLGSVDNTSDVNKPVSTAQAAALALKAPLDSPTFTGPVNVPNVAAGNNTALAANTAFVTAAVAQGKADILGSAPAALDTLNEFAAALGNDANFATTTATSLGNRLRVDTATQGLTAGQKTNAATNLGLAAVATSGAKADVGLGSVDNTSDASKPVSTATQTALNLKADKASPTFTGTATAPNFAGNLTGYKNVDNTNEMTLANGFAGGQLYMNYRGASSAITQVLVGNGIPASGVLAKIIALNIDASGNVTGNAATATKLATARTINGIAFDGTANITLAKADISLGSVDNTSDMGKPVSTAQAAAIALKQDAAGKDASDGFAGLTLFKLNLKNAAGAITSFLTSAATVARTWTFPDEDGTVAMLSDITGTNSGTNTGDETLATIKAKLGIATLSGSNTGDQTLASLGIPNVDNTSDVNKPVSTAQTAALALKANIASPVFTGVAAAPQFFSTTSNGYRMKDSTATTGYASFWRKDSSALYLMLTDLDNADGTFNALRPMTVTLATGKVNFGNGALTINHGGTVTAVTPAPGDNSTTLATTAYADTLGATKAPLTGAGTSGTWPIGVTGNAATATKLATPRTINGVAFDGTANISLGLAAVATSGAKADVGLGNADNTSDVNKPVSTAQAAALALKAPLDSPTFTGPVNVPNVAAGNNTALAANTAFVTAAVAQGKADILGSAPAALDTLNEFAAALGNDANFATTTATSLGNRLRVDTAAQGLTAGQKTNAATNLGLAAVATSGAKADVGLGSVDNTSDASKPVSTAQAAAIALKQDAAGKDASGGFAGLTLFKLNLKNVAGTFISFFTNTNTAARTYTLPDKDGTVAMLADITGTNSGINTGDETLATIKTKLGIATLSGSNTGDQTLASLGIPNVNNTSDAAKPVSTAQQAALDLKANIANPSFTGIVNSSGPIELGQVGTSNSPFIDFHSGATGVDYDARIMAGGGNGTSGNGSLQVYSASLDLTTAGNVTVATKAQGNNSTSAASTAYVDALGATKQASLGYTPIQQGGGATQGTNKIYIGWSSSNQMALQVDGTSFGSTWPMSVTGSAGSTTFVAALANYVWDASTLPASYALGIQSSFVQAAQGFPSYGSLMTMKTYSGGGGSLQMYVPYSPTNGGSSIKVRFGNFDVSSGNSWTGWGTIPCVENSNYWTGTQQFKGNKGNGSLNGAQFNYPLMAYSDDLGAAAMSFHRSGAYAINMGLDPDNVFRIGGWSMAQNRFQMDPSGNLTMAGNIIAYSDERLKTNWRSLQPTFIEEWAQVKHGVYDRIDSGETQLGVSAQGAQKVLPFSVTRQNDGYLAFNYGAAAAVATIQLSQEVLLLRAESRKQSALIKILMDRMPLEIPCVQRSRVAAMIDRLKKKIGLK
jgi:hypothetical protein